MEKKEWSFLSDSHLVKRVKEFNCDSSLLELSDRHGGLFFKILKKYSKSLAANNIKIEEVACDKNLVIWNSVNSFSENKNVKFSTWLANQTKYFCLNTLNKKNKDRLVTAGDELLDYFNEDNTALNNLDFANFLDYVENILSQLKDKRIKTIFSMRYSKEAKKPSWCNVASKLNISTQTAINLHNRGIVILRKKMQSKKFLDNV